jgi:hypothetical protein
MTQLKEKAEFGDFQTPHGLANSVCSFLAAEGVRPASLLEPTCGVGNFLFAAIDGFESIEQAVGVEINPERLRQAGEILGRRPEAGKIKLVEADFFATDWQQIIRDLPEPILVLGNPPWVTNAHLGAIGGKNLPRKANFQKHRGLDAITGKSNFDISEWMLIRLLEGMNGRYGTLAMLCKSSTARRVLSYAWKNAIALERSKSCAIDANLHFDAAVDAVLLVTHLRPGARSREAEVFGRLSERQAKAVIGESDGVLLADVAAYRHFKHLCGTEWLKWRSGIKHDCAKVMELSREGERYRNGFGELVELEDTYVYPMLKSSSVANGGETAQNRFMLVPQTAVGEHTEPIRQKGPRTWAYLQSHAERLDKRASSIYRKRPPFSIFGVGDYSFAPWKVAISGFYAKLNFLVVGPRHGKPVVLDDTSYFLPCRSEDEAIYLASLLNSPVARSFYGSFIFWDSKRPITAEVLRRLDLRRLAKELRSEEMFDLFFQRPDGGPAVTAPGAPSGCEAQLGLWTN